MPFGFTNAPATFQCLMECTLAGLSGEQCLIYLDDPDRNKTAAVVTYPTPQNSKEVRQFMGLSNYYRCFIPAYAQIAEPLHHLL